MESGSVVESVVVVVLVLDNDCGIVDWRVVFSVLVLVGAGVDLVVVGVLLVVGGGRGGAYRTSNTAAAKLTVVTGTWVHAGTIQGQGVATEVIVRSRRPIEAVTSSTIRRRRTEVAGVEEVVRISS